MEGQTLEGYLFEEEIGEGGFGSVYRVSKDNQNFAIKVIRNKGGINPGEMEQQFANHYKLTCPFLVKYISTFRNSKNLFVVMEYCPRGDLERLIKNLNPTEGVFLAEMTLMKIIIQLLLGLFELHNRKILHRDIKAANTFINEKSDVKIGDFGCGKILDASFSEAKSIVGSYSYLAPEIFQELPYSYPADIWSLGVLFYYICTAKLPFGESPFTLPQVVMKGVYSPIPEDVCSAEITQIITSMLQVDPSHRPTVVDLLKNPHIQKYAGKLKLLTYFPEDALSSASLEDVKPIDSSADFELIDSSADFELIDSSAASTTTSSSPSSSLSPSPFHSSTSSSAPSPQFRIKSQPQSLSHFWPQSQTKLQSRPLSAGLSSSSTLLPPVAPPPVSTSLAAVWSPAQKANEIVLTDGARTACCTPVKLIGSDCVISAAVVVGGGAQKFPAGVVSIIMKINKPHHFLDRYYMAGTEKEYRKRIIDRDIIIGAFTELPRDFSNFHNTLDNVEGVFYSSKRGAVFNKRDKIQDTQARMMEESHLVKLKVDINDGKFLCFVDGAQTANVIGNDAIKRGIYVVCGMNGYNNLFPKWSVEFVKWTQDLQ